MKNLSPKLAKIFLGAAFLLLAAACQNNGGRVTAPTAVTPPSASPANTAPANTQTPPKNLDAVGVDNQPGALNTIEYKGQAGKNALELLKAKYPGNIQIKQTSFGEMVIGINGVVPDNKHFWAFYVNGKFSNVGAGGYVTKDTDTLMWKLEEIK